MADAFLPEKTGPGEASLIHNARTSTTGNHKGMLSKIQVRSRIVFQEGNGKVAAVVGPVAKA
jgi:hypothetical protein